VIHVVVVVVVVVVVDYYATFWEEFLSKTAIPSVPSHSTKLAVTSTCEWVSTNSRRMGRQVEIGCQVLYESMLPECVTDGTNSIIHITQTRCNAFN
jgi:hypothetical protein